MKRRDFVFRSAAVAGAALARFDALAQSAAPLTATRTFQLFDNPSGPGPHMLPEVIFDGQKFLSLVATGPAQDASPNGIIAGGGPNAQYSLTATTPAGEKLWSYPLPQGRYQRLGTHAGTVAILGSLGANARPAAVRVLLLDPQSGKITDFCAAKPFSNFRYAGDSTFFNLANQQGEIWTLTDSLAEKVGGITLQPLTVLAPAVQYLQSGNILLATHDGASMALVSASSGYAVEHPINSDVIAASRNYYTSASTPFAGNPNSKPLILGAIGGDQNGNILGIVYGPGPAKAGVALIQMDSNGNATDLGRIVLPLGASNIPVFPIMLVGLSSEIGVIGANGAAAWYPRAA